MKLEKEIQENHNKEEWGGWKIVSNMLDNPNNYGIYPTGKCYQELYDFVVAQKTKALSKQKEQYKKEFKKWFKTGTEDIEDAIDRILK